MISITCGVASRHTADLQVFEWLLIVSGINKKQEGFRRKNSLREGTRTISFRLEDSRRERRKDCAVRARQYRIR